MTDSPLTQLDRLMERVNVLTETASDSVSRSSDDWMTAPPPAI